MRFNECPNCGNTQAGAVILKCKNCGEFCCQEGTSYLGGLIGEIEGCCDDNICPHCDTEFEVPIIGESNFKIVYTLGEDDDD